MHALDDVIDLEPFASDEAMLQLIPNVPIPDCFSPRSDPQYRMDDFLQVFGAISQLPRFIDHGVAHGARGIVANRDRLRLGCIIMPGGKGLGGHGAGRLWKECDKGRYHTLLNHDQLGPPEAAPHRLS